MIRSLYTTLVRFHPRSFQHHFGDEMLSIFDHTSRENRFALVGDAVFSLLRQWLLRPGLPEPANPAREYLAGAPMFLVIDDDLRLTRGQWTGGVVSSLLSFAAVLFLISHGGNRPERAIGSSESSQSGVRVESGAPATDLDGEVALPENMLEVGPARRLVAGYFEKIRVLSAIDLNHDFVISAGEIASAPEALRSLDANGDGALDAQECGGGLVEDFIRVNPVLAVLDANHDGLISGSEIRNAAPALERLDSDHDGRLTAEELLPDPLLKRLHVLLKEKGINHEQ